jgi:hypothetical protein
VPAPLRISLCEARTGDEPGTVYVEVRGKRPLPPAALERTHVQFGAVQERHTKLWLPEVKVSVLHLYKEPAAPWLGVGFEGASGSRFLDISRGSAERRLVERLLKQASFRVVWPVEGVEGSHEQPDLRDWLPKALAASEDLDAEMWEEAVYTLLRGFFDHAYEFGDRHKPGWQARPPRRRARADVGGPISSPVSGEPPAEDAPTVAGIRLPDGSRSPAGVPPHPPDAEDVLWCSDAAVADVLRLATSLAERFPETGLWPCLWVAFDEPASYCFEFLRDGADPADPDPAAVLAKLWNFWGPPAPEAVEPFTDGFPGLAPPTARGEPSNPFAGFAERWRPLDAQGDKLVLVPCNRPADVITAIGFECGPEGSAAASNISLLASVLRSWEERFHAFLVRLVPGGLTLAVQSPPETLEHALDVAAELYSFAPGEEARRPAALRELAGTLVRDSTHPRSSPYVWEFGWPS